MITGNGWDVNQPGSMPTYRPANVDELGNVTGRPTFRQVAWAGSFEAEGTIGLGVRGSASVPGVRAGPGPGPGTGSRIVVDAAHRC